MLLRNEVVAGYKENSSGCWTTSDNQVLGNGLLGEVAHSTYADDFGTYQARVRCKAIATEQLHLHNYSHARVRPHTAVAQHSLAQTTLCRKEAAKARGLHCEFLR